MGSPINNSSRDSSPDYNQSNLSPTPSNISLTSPISTGSPTSPRSPRSPRSPTSTTTSPTSSVASDFASPRSEVEYKAEEVAFEALRERKASDVKVDEPFHFTVWLTTKFYAAVDYFFHHMTPDQIQLGNEVEKRLESLEWDLKAIKDLEQRGRSDESSGIHDRLSYHSEGVGLTAERLKQAQENLKFLEANREKIEELGQYFKYSHLASKIDKLDDRINYQFERFQFTTRLKDFEEAISTYKKGDGSWKDFVKMQETFTDLNDLMKKYVNEKYEGSDKVPHAVQLYMKNQSYSNLQRAIAEDFPSLGRYTTRLLSSAKKIQQQRIKELGIKTRRLEKLIQRSKDLQIKHDDLKIKYNNLELDKKALIHNGATQKVLSEQENKKFKIEKLMEVAEDEINEINEQIANNNNDFIGEEVEWLNKVSQGELQQRIKSVQHFTDRLRNGESIKIIIRSLTDIIKNGNYSAFRSKFEELVVTFFGEPKDIVSEEGRTLAKNLIHPTNSSFSNKETRYLFNSIKQRYPELSIDLARLEQSIVESNIFSYKPSQTAPNVEMAPPPLLSTAKPALPAAPSYQSQSELMQKEHERLKKIQEDERVKKAKEDEEARKIKDATEGDGTKRIIIS